MLLLFSFRFLKSTDLLGYLVFLLAHVSLLDDSLNGQVCMLVDHFCAL